MRMGYMVRYAEHLTGSRRLSLDDSTAVAVRASECVSSVIVLGVVAGMARDRFNAFVKAVER